MQKSNIEWTDYTSNPIKYRERATGKVVWGCVKVSGGCGHCYAEDLAKRYGKGGPFTVGRMAELEPFVSEAELKALLSVKKLQAGSKVFVGDMTDIFGAWVPFEMLVRLFAVFARRPDVIFQLLTKRPERMREFIGDLMRGTPSVAVLKEAGLDELRWPLPNVWLGTSVEDQPAADKRIPELLATPAVVRYLSCEPLLGPVTLPREPSVSYGSCSENGRALGIEGRLHWVIVGGESGPKARPFDVAWGRSLHWQCASAGVAFFMKQYGSKPVDGRFSNDPADGFGKRIKLRHAHGGDIAEFPEDLRVREWPGAASAVVPSSEFREASGVGS